MNNSNAKATHLPFFDSLCVFFIMWSSGTQFTQDYPYAMYGLVMSLVCMIIAGDFSINNRMGGVIGVVFLLDILSSTLNIVFYSGEDLLLIQKVFVLLLAVLLYILNKPYRNAERIKLFITFIIVFSVISNILYIIHLTVGLPMRPTENGLGEHFFYLQKGVVNTIIGLPFRNSGIYWEPGMYQVYLTFALLFCLYAGPKRFRLLLVVYLILSTISTFSVSGYMVCALIMGVYAIRKQSSGVLVRFFYITIIIAALMYAFPYFLESITMKQDTGSYEARNNDLFFGFKVFMRSPLVGFGLGNHEYMDAYQSSFGAARQDSNGMINILISTGILGFSIVIIYFTKVIKWLKTHISHYVVWGFAIWFWISINTEPIVFHPFFFFLIGIGVSAIKTPITYPTKIALGGEK